MREGRRRPSLNDEVDDKEEGMVAAMREGRRRPSLAPMPDKEAIS